MVLTKVTPDFLETAPQRATVEVTVPFSVQKCWEPIVEGGMWVEWFPGAQKVVSDPPVWTKPGDRRTIHFPGLIAKEEAILVDLYKAYGFSILEWNMVPSAAKKAAEAVFFEDVGTPDDPATKLKYVLAFEVTFFGWLLWPILRPMMLNSWQRGFEGLKEYLQKLENQS